MQKSIFVRAAMSASLVALAASAALADPSQGRIETANAADPGEQASVRKTRDEAIRLDADKLAQSRGISSGQALKAVRAQEDIGDYVAALRKEFGGRVAGISAEYSPEYKLVVLLKGNAAPNKRLLNLASGGVPVEFKAGAQSSTEELVAAFERNIDQIRTLLPTVQGIGTDEKSGEIAVVVTASGSAAETVRGKKDDLFKLLGHPVRIDVVDQPTSDADVRGGSKITAPGSYCTSGFTVKNSAGTTGMTTSAHCEGIDTYYNPNGTTIALTHTGVEIKDADQDVEVHTSGMIERPEFYADVATTARVLTGKRLQSSTAAGNQACHRGATTGYSCGLVGLTNYQPTYANACGSVACSPVWITVNGDSSTACYGGDSGGPVFASQTAFGLLKGTNASGSGAGQCSFFIYMSTDRLPTGWSLVYG
ncbi:MAG TPA: S1 family peptidase [Allosphingosinicella sp.]|nr:S1 family peptidase [Allosphingosinicella sp.]